MLCWPFQPGPPPSYFACSKCGTSNQPYARFCVSCGVFIEPPSRQSSPGSPMDHGDSLASSEVGHIGYKLRGFSTGGMDQHSSIHFLGTRLWAGSARRAKTFVLLSAEKQLLPKALIQPFLDGRVRNNQPYKSLSSLNTFVLLAVNYLWSADTRYSFTKM